MGEASRLKKQKEEMFNKKMIKLVRFCWLCSFISGRNPEDKRMTGHQIRRYAEIRGLK